MKKPRAREWRGLSLQRSLCRAAKFKELLFVVTKADSISPLLRSGRSVLYDEAKSSSLDKSSFVLGLSIEKPRAHSVAGLEFAA
jgi:hypothetical protein